jgi:NADH:ubiquinone oxidoreductase subunit 5 (subunit L)/multisubunit Na+/H+ antiporter MnhA subunit
MLNWVFWGKSQREKHAHEAPWQMATPLVLLASGTVISWLGIGFLTRAYAAFEFHDVHGLTLGSFISETFSTPIVWVSLAAFLIGIGLFMIRKQYAKNTVGEQTMNAARKGYGFDTFYSGIIECLRRFAVHFRKTHTGDLNYNIAGIVLGFLLLIICIFFLGGF